MELPQEFIEKHGLNEDQVSAITNHVTSDYIPDLKKEWDGKASKNADGILDTVATGISKKYDLDLKRDQGEKYETYIERLSDAALGKEKQSITQQKADLDEKLKNFKGSDELKGQLEAERKKIDDYQKQLAELEPLKGLKEKYESTSGELSKLKKDMAFNNVKPTFPETANEYEVAAKWGKFIQTVEETYNIELVDGKPVAVDKENPHKVVELKELVAADQDIQSLTEGRQQKGIGSNGKPAKSIDGVPFKVPEGADSTEKTKLVREHLATQGVTANSPIYSEKFKELYTKISQA